MLDKLYFDKTFKALGNTLDILKQRHGLLASNISNLDTPGYKPRDIDFKDALSKALKSGGNSELTRTHPRHVQAGNDVSNSLEIVENTDAWNGLNHVNIDKEMTSLMENNLMYRTTVELLLKKISLLKEVIKEGGR